MEVGIFLSNEGEYIGFATDQTTNNIQKQKDQIRLHHNMSERACTTLGNKKQKNRINLQDSVKNIQREDKERIGMHR